ncbi:MAG: CatB-related O-acetyltransferase [Lachnospiraceae bacterium]|nr:CatB-related O-acetyltransferase [Lachnospiraceae bacterium]
MRIELSAERSNDLRTFRLSECNVKELKGFPICTIGRGSYVAEMIINFRLDQMPLDNLLYNFQIGKYCAVSDGVYCGIDMNHDYKSVSMYPPDYQEHVYNDRFQSKRKGQIIVENDCWLGHGCRILSGVTIHNGAVVGTDAVVAKDVPPYAIVVGNPARIIKYRFEQSIIDELLRIAWWDWDEDVIKSRIADFELPSEEFVSKYRAEKKTMEDVSLDKDRYLFFSDCMDDPFSILGKILFAFAEKTSGQLIVACRTDDEIQLIRDFAEGMFLEGRLIAVSKKGIKDTIIGAKARYLITNRSEENIDRMCFAQQMGMVCLSGVDSPIF